MGTLPAYIFRLNGIRSTRKNRGKKIKEILYQLVSLTKPFCRVIAVITRRNSNMIPFAEISF
jgi:hypothetical protein